MKQLLQSPATGSTTVADVPAPLLSGGMVLVRTAASVVSAGTERTSVEFAKKSLLAKARSRPDLVKKVLDKALTDGALTAWDAARARLEQPQALGYSSAGVVIALGEGAGGFRVGDRVACAGGGYASHAEIVRVPTNLAAPVPAGVALEHAAFATVGAIGLHGLRLAEPQLGETVAVVGLGVIGLLVVQMAKAAGCRVVGIDVDPGRVELAQVLGADAALLGGGEDVPDAVRALTGARGVDAAVVAAAASSSEPVVLAAELCRDRGRVVVIGAVGMDLPRPLFYEKELSLRVSRSYGPGRYDPLYEEAGIDYPVGYVRWTENRNLSAFLDLVDTGGVKVEPLITHRVPIADGARAYQVITGGERSLGVILTYPDGPLEPSDDIPLHRVDRRAPDQEGAASSGPGVGLLGAGSFATGTLLPALKEAGGFRFVGVATATGASGHHVADKYGFRFATTDEDQVLSDPEVELVAAFEAGKHVFCEKPPALTEVELAEVVRAYARAPGRMFSVGYNRRFSPMAERMKEFLAAAGEPPLLNCRVNAGLIPADHWLHDPAVGGGRIIGEGCHFVDLLSFLADSLPVGVSATGLPDGGRYREDNVVIALAFENGSVGTITYVAAGDRAMGKERVEAFGGGVSAALDDYRTLALHRGGKSQRDRSRLRQDKGHVGEWHAIGSALREGGELPISLESLVATSLATFAAVRSLRTGEAETLDVREWLGAVRAAVPPQARVPG